MSGGILGSGLKRLCSVFSVTGSFVYDIIGFISVGLLVNSICESSETQIQSFICLSREKRVLVSPAGSIYAFQNQNTLC